MPKTADGQSVAELSRAFQAELQRIKPSLSYNDSWIRPTGNPDSNDNVLQALFNLAEVAATKANTGEWVGITALPDQLVVNVGDITQHLPTLTDYELGKLMQEILTEYEKREISSKAESSASWTLPLPVPATMIPSSCMPVARACASNASTSNAPAPAWLMMISTLGQDAGGGRDKATSSA